MEAAQKPQFFKVLLQDCKLSIPPAFVKHIVDDNHGKATIFSFGKFWHVKVQRDKEGLFFGDGWDEIMAAHELDRGFFLVFRYEGNMVFTLKVFDLSSCRRYHTPKKRKGATTSADEDTENPLHDDSGRLKRRSINAEESMELKRKKMLTSSFAEKQSQLINMKKDMIQFSKTIRKSNVVHFYLSVPVPFCASNGFSTTQEVILRDSKGKSFPVNLSSPRLSPKFSKGWRVFSEENNLKEGDTCVFELDSGNKNIMHVQIKYKL